MSVFCNHNEDTSRISSNRSVLWHGGKHTELPIFLSAAAARNVRISTQLASGCKHLMQMQIWQLVGVARMSMQLGIATLAEIDDSARCSWIRLSDFVDTCSFWVSATINRKFCQRVIWCWARHCAHMPFEHFLIRMDFTVKDTVLLSVFGHVFVLSLYFP
jgi:hypothetical protein